MNNKTIKHCEGCSFCKNEVFNVPNDSKCNTHYTAFCSYKNCFLAINARTSDTLPLPKNCPVSAFNSQI